VTVAPSRPIGATERSVEVPSHDGGTHRWSIQDRPGTDPSAPTVVCLHGNPTWSFLWSRVLEELHPRHRVIAPDHLNMGHSERVGQRAYRARVDDIADLLGALGLTEPVWLVAQDWGGAIAMGVAVHHPHLVAGLVLSNTGIAVPQGRKAPWLIRVAATHGIHRIVTRSTSLFVRGTPWLPGGHLTSEQRTALAAPYRRAADRDGVAAFVADVPFDDRHPSAAAIAEVAAALPGLRVPVRLVWGGRDPVFDDTFADDLLQRMPGAQLHRLPRSGHLAVLDASIAPFIEGAIASANEDVTSPHAAPHAPHAPAFDDVRPLWASIVERAADTSVAIDDAHANETVSHAVFAERVGRAVAGLRAAGVEPGDRVAVLVPPSVDLLAVIYACWRIGAVTVVADRGLGLRGLGAAVRSARVRHVVGPRQALAASRTLRWAPRANTISLRSLRGAPPSALADPADPALPSPGPDMPAAVVFTSGATGPAKGVRYTHRQLCAQRDAIRSVYDIQPTDRFVAAFAPFAVFGPALGIVTGLADMDVTAPATLTASALEDACRRIEATMVFAAPAALANVLRTATGPTPATAAVRLVLSAGAPVPMATLEAMATRCPNASLHTPYGMTEVLPVADESLVQRRAVGRGRGVCVGHPVHGCDVRIVPMDPDDGLHVLHTGGTGEVLVRAPWMSTGYDRLFLTEQRARPVIDGAEWHRTGDVGHLDASGNLWIEGRVVHVIRTAAGPVTPVPLEVAVEALPGVRRAAAVGVGPAGVQQVVIVLEPEDGDEGEASGELADAVRRSVAPHSVSAVWMVGDLPVDIRHNSKIDRAAVAARMERVLSGARR
jgi:acyl-CoA synthetase (AMP-forming)/AMP-acid ligase II/pimeloyl-ACP methyl ester carboxylesterase